MKTDRKTDRNELNLTCTIWGLASFKRCFVRFIDCIQLCVALFWTNVGADTALSIPAVYCSQFLCCCS